MFILRSIYGSCLLFQQKKNPAASEIGKYFLVSSVYSKVGRHFCFEENGSLRNTVNTPYAVILTAHTVSQLCNITKITEFKLTMNMKILWCKMCGKMSEN